MSYSSPILIVAEDYVFDLFKKSTNSKLIYHNFKHTSNVVKNVHEIGTAEKLTEEELEIVLLAAWFHDVGYITSCDNHEELSAKLASDFLMNQKYDTQKIGVIKNCILATKLKTEPNNHLEEIICDADTKNVGSNSYYEHSFLLRTECECVKHIILEEQEWLEKEIEFLNRHKFYTKYAFLNLIETKIKNLIQRQEELDKLIRKKNKPDIPEKGIETMFRTALKNHMELSAMADNKANIMLSINALIISIVISALVSKFDKHPELVFPTVLLLIICLTAIVLATLSTKPKITSGKFTTQDVKEQKANLLFFGNFHKMQLHNYEWGMKEIMKDSNYLYSSLIRDLYFLGVVLAKKYTYLRWCYMVFMYGMILAVLVFAFIIITTEHI
ncbi:MAG: HD family phosphohydrolase [Flavobacteriales bacterium CG18_big_fil_WC_8_21_14_2_50_32_9]|nr:MAG: HD family phosphohydrolase [Flavobacteriales bacterium CG18_big_fil_WC_8_21_14_2_50_32_9]PJC63007.1 MAG: HD family phosphohydrolase [Flavobacteriales bacterium CG_4_9_14_0_2_um_filter_32_27]